MRKYLGQMQVALIFFLLLHSASCLTATIQKPSQSSAIPQEDQNTKKSPADINTNATIAPESISSAISSENQNLAKKPIATNGVAEERAKKEERIPPNFFAITFYKPTYILPYYYTGSPARGVYSNNTPDGEEIKNSELKYQLSFKVPVFRNVLGSNSSLYLAYTQLSYWQAYNKTAFFRETDYEPELFISNEVNLPLPFFKDWHVNFINVGGIHQSNGFGGHMERSWNRIYVEAISSTDCWMISVKPWFVIRDTTMRKHNSNITDYLGYGQILIGYKYYNQVLTIQAHNLLEGGGRRATAELNWSFPLSSYFNGYVQIFSGYGQSLIEYDHRTNSFGLGIALSNWI